MLLSTLPTVPGRAFEVRGCVCVHLTLGSGRGDKVQKMMDTLVEQARRVGADGIVDLRTVIGGDYAECVMTGTAVRLLPATPAG